MSQLKKSAKSVGIIMVFTLASKVLGFLREALIASNYGSGSETDTFFIAFSAISLFAKILTNTTNTTLIPVLSDVEVNEGKKAKLSHLNNFLNTILLTAGILAVIAYFLAPFVIRIVGKGFEGEQFQQTVLLMRIGLPILLTSTIVGVFRAYLQSEEKFTESAIADIPFNIVYIIFLFFLAQYFSITALMITAILAEVSRISIQLPALRRIDYRYRFKIDLKDEYMKKIAVLVPPVLLSVGISDLNSIVDKSMASSLVSGSISSLNYAVRLNGVIQGIFITAIITVIFPILSKEANAKNYARLKKIMHLSLNVILLILIPAAIGMILLANPAVKFAYQRGEFGDVAAMMTSSALVYYSLGIVAVGVKSFLIRIFYALQDTKIALWNSLLALVLNVIFNLILIGPMGHNGLALASSISNILTAVILLYLLRRKIGNLGLTKMIQSALKIAASSLIMGIFVYIAYNGSMAYLNPSRIMELVILAAIVLAAIVIYLVFLYLFKVEELHFLIDLVKGRLKKE